MTNATEEGLAGTGYVPPETPEQDSPLWLGLKIAAAMFLADLIASTIGFEAPTWSIIVAAYLSTQPPLSSVGGAKEKLMAMVVGLALGTLFAWLHQFVPAQGVALTFGVIGFVAGALAVRSSNYVFAGVVATIVTFTAQTGEEPVLTEAVRAGCMIAIGCAVGPAVVWAVERLRAWRHARGRAVPAE